MCSGFAVAEISREPVKGRVELSLDVLISLVFGNVMRTTVDWLITRKKRHWNRQQKAGHDTLWSVFDTVRTKGRKRSKMIELRGRTEFQHRSSNPRTPFKRSAIRPNRNSRRLFLVGSAVYQKNRNNFSLIARSKWWSIELDIHSWFDSHLVFQQFSVHQRFSRVIFRHDEIERVGSVQLYYSTVELEIVGINVISLLQNTVEKVLTWGT